MQFCVSESHLQTRLQSRSWLFSLPTAREIFGDEKIKTDGFIKYIGLPLHLKTFYSIRHGTLPYETNHFRFRCLHHPKQQIFLMILHHRSCARSRRCQVWIRILACGTEAYHRLSYYILWICFPSTDQLWLSHNLQHN